MKCKHKRGRARLRRLWLHLHLWIGLSVGTLMVVIGLSGSMLVWRDGLEKLNNPARYAVTAGRGLLPPSTYVGNAAASLGHSIQPETIRYPEGSRSPVTVSAREGTSACPTPDAPRATLDGEDDGSHLADWPASDDGDARWLRHCAVAAVARRASDVPEARPGQRKLTGAHK
jgi:PepSY-associated TM region